MIKHKKKIKNGFSVVEFIVVVSIFATMSSITLFNYNEYRQRIEELNVAQDIAITLRQAQIYGISASNRDVGQTFADDEEEATFFTSTIADITDNTSIRGLAIDPGTNTLSVFEDVNYDNEYTAGLDVLIDERQILTTRVYTKVCIDDTLPTDFTTCTNIESGNELVHVTFQRPYPDAYVVYDGTSYSYVWIGFFGNLSDAEPSSYVAIDPSGQISVVRN